MGATNQNFSPNLLGTEMSMFPFHLRQKYKSACEVNPTRENEDVPLA